MNTPHRKLSFILLLLIITTLLTPLSKIHAIGIGDLLGIAKDENDPCKSLIDSALDKAKDTVLGTITSSISSSVPVHDDDVGKQLKIIRDLSCETKKNTEAIRKKEAGQLKLLGITIPGTSWDAIATAATKALLERIVDSTVDWINAGFEGKPAFVTDPAQYFGNLADGIAGEFIQGSDLGFVCSPFQAQIRISLSTNYNRGESRRAFQCTLSEAYGNVESFFNGDFNRGGGWNTWFNVTQNSANNPYGAYLEAKVELDSRIARAIGVDEKLLDWGSGFLGTRACASDQDGVEKRDKNTKECLEWGPTVTPGTLIEGQLQKQLGSSVAQLELADEFDELTVALANQLLKKAQSVLSQKGLNSSGGNTGAPKPQSLVACVPSRHQVRVGESVTWTAINLLGENPTYSWTGEGLIGATTDNIDIVYTTTGMKTASVAIQALSPAGTTLSATANCINSVEVIDLVDTQSIQ